MQKPCVYDQPCIVSYRIAFICRKLTHL